jgi:hypothetical protein
MSEEIGLRIAESLNLSISDDDLLSKVKNREDNFIERKPVKDTRGWLLTAVAFANSCPVGYPGVLFIGVNDDGTIQQHQPPLNFEKLQMSVSARINEAWPPIYHFVKTLRIDGAEFLAVIVPGSSLRPHFSGAAFVRVGPQTKNASEDQYDALIAQRSSKVRELQKLIGKPILWTRYGHFHDGTVVDCNQFFLTASFDGSSNQCFPIDWITISFDPERNRHHLYVQD